MTPSSLSSLIRPSEELIKIIKIPHELVAQPGFRKPLKVTGVPLRIPSTATAASASSSSRTVGEDIAGTPTASPVSPVYESGSEDEAAGDPDTDWTAAANVATQSPLRGRGARSSASSASSSSFSAAAAASSAATFFESPVSIPDVSPANAGSLKVPQHHVQQQQQQNRQHNLRPRHHSNYQQELPQQSHLHQGGVGEILRSAMLETSESLDWAYSRQEPRRPGVVAAVLVFVGGSSCLPHGDWPGPAAATASASVAIEAGCSSGGIRTAGGAAIPVLVPARQHKLLYDVAAAAAAAAPPNSVRSNDARHPLADTDEEGWLHGVELDLLGTPKGVWEDFLKM
ncbi:hypothetical protein DFJ73DRAFT_761859 [Zopfochytrium polystomum]|nr:hypothetical protein DFJ73DRAFT_761859 [Zopfochytrium polystomum]